MIDPTIMDDVRTADRRAARQRWAREWVARRIAMRELNRAGNRMRAMGIAAVAARRGFAAVAREAGAVAEVERIWTDG
jgi:hypothetical protein